MEHRIFAPIRVSKDTLKVLLDLPENIEITSPEEIEIQLTVKVDVENPLDAPFAAAGQAERVIKHALELRGSPASSAPVPVQ